MEVKQQAKKSFTEGTKNNKGLSEKEACQNYQKYGPNALLSGKKKSVIKLLLAQFSDFMVLILLASTAISVFMGEVVEAITIIFIVVLNAILGFVQEYRTEKTMEALKNMAAPSSKVIRDGIEKIVLAKNIVPEDLIVLEAGDRVPADAILVESSSLMLDESLLTGESMQVEKGAHIANRNQIFMGTIVTGGRCIAQVFSTGMKTEMGKIADMLENIDDEQTPLQKRLDSLGKYIVFGCLIICAIVTMTGILRGEDLFTMLLAGISLAVAAVPEGLPAIVTISLALGVQRMVKRNALIRRLPAVETLGSADVICSDKTGTLTENKMTVRSVYAGENLINIDSSSSSKEWKFFSGLRELNPISQGSVNLALEIGVICNNAKIAYDINSEKSTIKRVLSSVKKKEDIKINGDPTEASLIMVAHKCGINIDKIHERYTRKKELPFDSDRKLMSVICKNDKGETFIFTKGAPEVLLDRCSKVHTKNGEADLKPSLKTGLMKINDNMAREALRVLAVGYRKLSGAIDSINPKEENLVFVGFVGMIDPPRREAMDAVTRCRMAGIKTVMITGDHKITASAIATELDILREGDRVLTGKELEKMKENDLEKIANDVSVFARVTPKHKLMIVRVLKKLGHVVAMTGDGVNDAPAVKEADIGVAMGITGTDVTKEASSMILMDDNFATIVAAVEEGRVIYNNIRKFIRYMLSCNIGEVITMFVGMLVGLPLPLLPIQILWVNLVTDGLPAIALGMDPPENNIMMKSPRGGKENIFSNGLLGIIIFRGLIIAFSTLAVFISIFYFTVNLEMARTGAFVTLVITQLIHVFECKSESKNIFEIKLFDNKLLVGSVLISIAMILGVVYIPFFQTIFSTVALGLEDWMLIMGFSALGPVLSSILKIKVRRK